MQSLVFKTDNMVLTTVCDFLSKVKGLAKQCKYEDVCLEFRENTVHIQEVVLAI